MRLDNLQILRGISALLVCCFHFKEYLNIGTSTIGDFLFSKGSVGVQIFFIISGFIMTYTSSNKKYDTPSLKIFKDFIIKRVIRILPLYYLLTLAWIILGGSISLYLVGENFSRFWHSILFLPQTGKFPVLYLGWSLNYEMFFYLLFAISLFFGKWRSVILISILFINIVISFILKFESPILSLATSYLNIYFLIGILLGLFHNKVAILKKFRLLFFIISILVFTIFLTPLFTWNDLTTILVITLLVFGFFQLQGSFNTRFSKALVKIGDISFSLYLIHPFVEFFLRRFNTNSWINIPLFFLLISLSLILANVLYKIVETKITNYLKNKLL